MHHVARVRGPVIVGLMLVMIGCAGDSAGSKVAFCEGLAELVTTVETSDPRTFAGSLRDLAALAPSADLRQATSLLADNYAVFADVPTGDLEALEKAFGDIDEEATNAAVSIIESYGVDECGIDDF